jgi:hypothetical protein
MKELLVLYGSQTGDASPSLPFMKELLVLYGSQTGDASPSLPFAPTRYRRCGVSQAVGRGSVSFTWA